MPRKKPASVVQGATLPRRPGRPRKPKVRVPPVPMAMPWVHPASGVTVSHVCPVCRTRQDIRPSETQRLTRLRHVPLAELACSAACHELWWNALIDAIQATGQQHVLRDMVWVYELQQGVVAERLAEVLSQDATRIQNGKKEYVWPRRN